MKQSVQRFYLVCFLFCLIFVNCSTRSNIDDNDREETVSADEICGTIVSDVRDETEALLSGMSLEEKVGQLFIIDIRKPVTGDPIQYVDDYVTSLLSTYKPGGVILFGGNLRNPSQARKLIRNMQKLSRIPLFVSIDEEGGPISRLNYSPEMSPGIMPSAMSIGKTGDPMNAFEAGELIGRQLYSLGINMNNAPVADILTNPSNPVIGPRSYGSNVDLVCRMVSAHIEGLRAAGIIGVMKHFPGHGDTVADSHSGRVRVQHTRERLEQIELKPFEAGIKAGGSAIMTAHINVTEIEDIPATFSKILLIEMLRKELGFTGLIISDSLGMGAIANYWKPDEAAVEALTAGVDMILIPDDLAAAFEGVYRAVESGRLPEADLDEKVARILDVKREYRISDSIPDNDQDKEWYFPEIKTFYKRILGLK